MNKSELVMCSYIYRCLFGGSVEQKTEVVRKDLREDTLRDVYDMVAFVEAEDASVQNAVRNFILARATAQKAEDEYTDLVNDYLEEAEEEDRKAEEDRRADEALRLAENMVCREFALFSAIGQGRYFFSLWSGETMLASFVHKDVPAVIIALNAMFPGIVVEQV